MAVAEVNIPPKMAGVERRYGMNYQTAVNHFARNLNKTDGGTKAGTFHLVLDFRPF